MKTSDPARSLARLEAFIAENGPLAVAVSGGVDSMTLASIVHGVRPGSVMYHAVSPAVPATASARVERYAGLYGWQLRIIDAGEMQDHNYRRNPLNRCYYCKHNLYQSIRRCTDLVIASGTNLDDLNDFRPGLEAAREQQVIHPLVEAGINKAVVRELAAKLGLRDLEELPASPCLSSRITTGIAIDADLLPLIDEVENRLREKLSLVTPLSAVRCRIRHQQIAVQLDTGNINQAKLAFAGLVESEVREVFSDRKYQAYRDNIVIEAYRQGSAFIRTVKHGG